MANGQKKKGGQTQTKPNVKADCIDATKPASEHLQNGDLRTAIVSEALVAKLIDSTVFMSSLAVKLEANGALGCNFSTLENVRQDMYESCKMDIYKAADTENLTRRRVDLLRKARDSPNVEASC